MNLDHIPIADHHADPFLRPAAANDPARFRRWFTESTDPRVDEQYVTDTLVLRMAVRWLAELLGCDATLEAVVAARAAQPEEAWVARLFRDANIDLLLCDYGYGGEDVYDHLAMQRLVPCRVEPILRLERLAEQLHRAERQLCPDGGRLRRCRGPSAGGRLRGAQEHHRLPFRPAD